MKTASCPIFGPRSTSPTRIHPGGNCFSRKPDLYRLYRLYNAYAGKEYVWGKGLEDLDNLYNPYKAVRPAKLALCHVFEGHGARVALQRCPILRDVLTIAKSPPFLQPKTDKKLTRLNL
jgi:hypothetical protein